MTQMEKTKAFAALHVKGNPLVLYNIWDAGTAKAIADEGAIAVATGSWSVAAAHGYKDGEAIPLDLVFTIAERIVASVDVPVTIDFEGGYAEEHKALADNIKGLIKTGAAGLNFEDQKVGAEGLYDIETQAARVKTVRHAADEAGVPLFINARTDLFLKQKDRTQHAGLLEETIARAHAYAEAGASGFFAPALVEPGLIKQLCAQSPLPVNIMMMDGAPGIAEQGSLGVARISYGPGPYLSAMTRLTDAFKELR
ncbi:MAG: isocitrate lyase/PEP mutase family protein [Hyphomicrobiales bacterium]